MIWIVFLLGFLLAQPALAADVRPSAPTSISGNAGTATTLAADPADCTAGQVALGITADGTATCTATPTVTSIQGIVGNVTPAAGTFTTLAGTTSVTTPVLIGSSNVLDFRNGTNTQQFNIYKTFTDASNYERMALYSDANRFYILQQKAGTGSARILSIVSLDKLELGSSGGGWDITTGGHFVPEGVTNNFDVGLTGTRPRTIYAGTSVVSPLYVAGSTSGVAGPVTCTSVTSITVVGGIVTAIAGVGC